MKIHAVMAASAAIAFTNSALAAVSAEEAKQLGTTLTLWGAEKAGNKEGTIPEWGGKIKVPANYDPKKPGDRPDPFADEKPLYSITAQNMDKYADKVTEGFKVMLKKFPTFRMDVYPSHRNVTYPQYVLDNNIKNATSCKALDSGLRLDGCYAGLPFPIPKTGNEVMWNHVIGFNAIAWDGQFSGNLIDNNGKNFVQAVNFGHQDSPWYNPKRTGTNAPNLVYWRLRADVSGPARRIGEKLLFIGFADSVNFPPRAWQYIPGQRRVKLAPDLAYDTPNPQGGGGANMDDGKLYMGAQDRFDFKLIGKKEMFIPYNMYKYSDGKICPDKVSFTKNHLNPDCVRWELHRVWVVEARLKPEFRHNYKRRVFYWDEDHQGAGMSDNFDALDKIYRVGFTVSTPYYESNGLNFDESVIYQPETGTYMVSGQAAELGGWYPVTPDASAERFYTPESLAAEGIR